MSENIKNELFKAIISLRNAEECENFFRDLCTEREIGDLSARLRVAKLLDLGVNYNDIAAETGASTATISRVSKCLSGDVGGYRSVLARLEAPETDVDGVLPYLSEREQRALYLKKLYRENGYPEEELSDTVDYDAIRLYNEYCDSSDYLIYQNGRGRLNVISPDAAPVIFETFREEGRRLSYSYKALKRNKSSVSSETELGIHYIGESREELAVQFNIAKEAVRAQSRNAQISVFNNKLFRNLFYAYRIPVELRCELLSAIDGGGVKRLEELRESGAITEELVEKLGFLFKLPENIDEALARLAEIFNDPLSRVAIDELRAFLASVDKKRVRVEPNCAASGGGIVYSSPKLRLYGKEYTEPYKGVGFKIIL